MRHRQRENSPTAPDILPPEDDDYAVTINKNAVYKRDQAAAVAKALVVDRMSPQSRRRAEFTIDRLQRGGSLFGRARSTLGGLRPRFGGRDETAASSLAIRSTSTEVATVPDKRLHKPSHRTLEFFTLWAGGRNKKTAAAAAVTSGTMGTSTGLQASASSEKRILVDNTNINPSTVVRNSGALVSASATDDQLQQQQKLHNCSPQNQKQRRFAENATSDYCPSTVNTSSHAVKSTIANTKTKHAIITTGSTASPTTNTPKTASASAAERLRHRAIWTDEPALPTTTSANNYKRRYTRNNTVDLSAMRSYHEQQHQPQQQHPQRQDAVDFDRHVVFVNMQLFGDSAERNRPIIRSDEGADNAKRRVIIRRNSAIDKHSTAITNITNDAHCRPSLRNGITTAPAPPEAVKRAKPTAGILQRHSSVEVGAVYTGTNRRYEDGSKDIVRDTDVDGQDGQMPSLRVNNGRPKKKLSFREPVENERPFVFKSETLPRAKRFLANIEKQQRDAMMAAATDGLDARDDDELEVVLTG